MNSSTAVVIDPVVIDAEAEGIQISNGRDMTIRNCQAYSRGYHENWNTPSGTLNTSLSDYERRGLDYGFLISGGTETRNNSILGCRVEFKYSQFTDPPETKVYQGHAFGISASSAEPEMFNNLIRDCTVRAGADAVVIRGQNTFDNTVEDIEIDLTSYVMALVRGAHHNTSKRLIGHRICSVLKTDSSVADADIRDNRFLNCGFEFHGTDTIIHGITGSNYSIRDNLFCNCTFIAKDNGVYSRISAVSDSTISSTNNTFVNCIIYDFADLKGGRVSAPFDCDFVNCNFFQTPFYPNPTQQGATFHICNADDPGLVNTGPPPTSDFHLAPGLLIAGAYEFNGAADRGTQRFELQQYLDPALLLDIDHESGAYDPINTGSSVRYDIGCDEYYP